MTGVMVIVAATSGGLVAACGGGGDDGNGAVIDAHMIDAPVPACNTGAGDIACDFSCAGMSWPTTAPADIDLTGVVENPILGAVGDAYVSIHSVSDDAMLGEATAAGDGQYTASLSTGGNAPTLYRRVQADGNLDGYEYDPTPVFDVEHAARNVPSMPESDLHVVYTGGGIADTDVTKGTVIVYVRDCANHLVANALVDVPGALRVVYESGNQPVSSTATKTGIHGWAYALKVPPGTVDITVTAGSTTFRSWPIKVVANAVTSSPRMP